MSQTLRPKELGMLVVVGGPGGSGSSTISKMLAQKWYLHRVCGGDLIRRIAGKDGVETIIKDRLKNDPKIDTEIDAYLIKMSFQKNILIESKVFAALSTIKHIPATVKIWLYADVNTSVKRILQREHWVFDQKRYNQEVKKLEKRRSDDAKRYMDLYGVDITKPEKYNDIIIDSSKINAYNTQKLIIDKIKEDPYLSSRFLPEHLKY